MARLRPISVALLGFGSVGRRFVELLDGPYGRVFRDRGLEPRVTGIQTAAHGGAIVPSGFPAAEALRLVQRGDSLSRLHRGRPLTSSRDFIRRVPADVLVELTPLEPRTGEPAVTHVRSALERGLHVVTANKGAVAFGSRKLQALARRKDRLFLHEGAVMDGAPVFALAERCLPGLRILGFRGALNSTTTRILTRMEEGATAREALHEAQAAGIAEADPRNDLEGWDAAVKGCAIANALMGAAVTPAAVVRVGIVRITMSRVARGLSAGRRYRLVVRGRREGGRVRVSVAPEALKVDDILASRGCDGVLVLETDLLGEIGIWEGAGGLDQTAYAILADLLRTAEERS